MVCLSGWLPHGRAGPASALQLGWQIPAEVSGTPTLCCHGLADAVVTPALSELSCAALTEAGYKAVERRTFAGLGHESSAAELDAVCTFLQRAVPSVFERPRSPMPAAAAVAAAAGPKVKTSRMPNYPTAAPPPPAGAEPAGPEPEPVFGPLLPAAVVGLAGEETVKPVHALEQTAEMLTVHVQLPLLTALGPDFELAVAPKTLRVKAVAPAGGGRSVRHTVCHATQPRPSIAATAARSGPSWRRGG